MSLINRETLYEKACDLEAQALSYVAKIANDETKIEEWKIWSAILIERTAFKHDIFDAPEELPSARPEITPDGTLKVTVDADIASIGRILLSQAGTQCGGLYYKDAQPEITLESAIDYLHSIGWMQEHDRELPSAQPYTEEQLQKMQDLEQAEIEKAYELGRKDAKAEIVRCKDCRWSGANEIGDLSECHHVRGLVNASPNGYCNFAERRTDERTD